MTIIIKNSYNDDNDNENNSMQPNFFSNNASRGQADAMRTGSKTITILPAQCQVTPISWSISWDRGDILGYITNVNQTFRDMQYNGRMGFNGIYIYYKYIHI